MVKIVKVNDNDSYLRCQVRIRKCFSSSFLLADSNRRKGHATRVCIPLAADTFIGLNCALFERFKRLERLERKTAAFFKQGYVNIVREMARTIRRVDDEPAKINAIALIGKRGERITTWFSQLNRLH